MAHPTGRRGGQLYELRGPMRELRRERGWSQGDLARASRTYGQVISQVELCTTRITGAKAKRICAALGVPLDELFLCVLPTNTAAKLVGIETNRLIAAAHDPRSPITPYAIEAKGAYKRCYFIESDLREQLANLPSCADESCEERTLRVGGYCKRHTWKACHLANERKPRAKRQAALRSRAPRLDWPAITKEMYQFYETGLTCAQVGERMGYSRDVVVRRLGKAGYTLSRGPRSCSPAMAEVLRRAREVAKSGKRTTLELAGRALLESLRVDFIEQHPLGVYTVDFFIPKIGLVIEADGSYWHQSEAKERARDAYLLREPGVRDILHLTEVQLQPWVPVAAIRAA